jgi:hypothetical protein
MSLECPHKITKKDGHLHEIAQKDGRLPYLVILCQHTVVVRVSLGECWVRYVPTKYCIILENTLYCLFAVAK